MKVKAPKFSMRSFMMGTTMGTAFMVLLLVSVFAIAMKPRNAGKQLPQQQTHPRGVGKYAAPASFAPIEHFCDQGFCTI